jgi:glycosyltransferase involved in cell wall biosynthesis
MCFHRPHASENDASGTIEPMCLPRLGTTPLVSVIVANYNYASYLRLAVESVLAQRYRNFELIICDDGSNDHSQSVIAQLAESDARITGIFKENAGQASAWNAAYLRSRGEIICLLDADDLYAPTKLERVVNAFRKNPESALVYHRYQAIDRDGEALDGPVPETLLAGWLASRALSTGGADFKAATSQLCFRRPLADEVFPLPKRLKGYGDAFIQGIAQLRTVVFALPDALSYYRIHGENDSGAIGPDPRSTNSLIDAYLISHREIREFAERSFGPHVAARLRLEELGPLWDQLGALYIMTGKPNDGVRGYNREEILRRLLTTRRGYVWWILFTMPTGLSRILLRQWWTRAWWKRYTRKLTRRAGFSNDWLGAESTEQQAFN